MNNKLNVKMTILSTVSLIAGIIFVNRFYTHNYETKIETRDCIIDSLKQLRPQKYIVAIKNKPVDVMEIPTDQYMWITTNDGLTVKFKYNSTLDRVEKLICE